MRLKDRLQHLLDEQPDKTKAGLARACGIKAPSVSAWFSGRTESLAGNNLLQAAAYFGVTPEWLSTGTGNRYSDMPREEPNITTGPQVRTVPLLNSVSAGMYKEIIDQHIEVEHVATAAQVRRYTYALRIEGDSMEPTFTAGMMVIIEPELDPSPGDYVVAVNGDNEATFKQLIRDGSEWMLKPLNTRYPIRPLGDSRIIGVCTGAQIFFR